MKVWSNIIFYVLLLSAISPSQQVKKCKCSPYVSILMTHRFSVSLDNPALCSKTTKRKLTYESLVVTDVRSRSGIFPKICKFEVKSFYKHGGVIAVIEYLNLITKQHSTECREYIQFRTKKGVSSQRYCELDENMITTVPWNKDVSPKIRGPRYINVQDVANNSFIDFDGEMDVIIFLTEGEVEHYNETLFSIVFTSFVGTNRFIQIYHCLNYIFQTAQLAQILATWKTALIITAFASTANISVMGTLTVHILDAVMNSGAPNRWVPFCIVIKWLSHFYLFNLLQLAGKKRRYLRWFWRLE